MISKTFNDTNLLKHLKEQAQKDFVEKVRKLFENYQDQKSLELFFSNDFELEYDFLEFVYNDIYEIKNEISSYYVPSNITDSLNIFIFDRMEIDDCAREYMSDYFMGKADVSMLIAFGIERSIYDFLDEHDVEIIEFIKFKRTHFIHYVIENLEPNLYALCKNIGDFDDKHQFIKDYITDNKIEDINLLLN